MTRRADYEKDTHAGSETLYKLQVWTPQWKEWYTDHVSVDYGRILSRVEAFTESVEWRIVEVYATHRTTLLATDRTPRTYVESAQRILGQS